MFSYFRERTFSLRKSRHILTWANSWYQEKADTLTTTDRASIEKNLEALDNAVLSKDRTAANTLARQVQEQLHHRIQKPLWKSTIEISIAIAIALAIAIVVRQVWFEHMEIPTGSMRPTLKEQDLLLVSKTPYGINIPLQTSHFYFDPDLIKNGSIVIWTGDNIDLPNTDTTLFGLFPYKKRYVKRVIGKPGDTLYFYGGKVYGIDKNGNPIEALLDLPLEHIPFSTFEGRFNSDKQGHIYFRHMNLPIGRVTSPATGEISSNGKWTKDRPRTPQDNTSRIQTLSDFWGIRNYAMTRLLTRNQVKNYTSIDPDTLEEGLLYLQLRHTPNLNNSRITPTPQHHNTIILNSQTTIIPLKREHLNTLQQALYTARFVIKDNHAHRYSAQGIQLTSDTPRFQNIPDGTYEFYNGIAYKIHTGGIATQLPSDHPLYDPSPENIQRLYNLGIEFSTFDKPHNRNQTTYPSRYAYFRNGDLYTMNAPIFTSDDPYLRSFLDREQQKTHPFIDHGPPSPSDLQTFGLKIPDGHYLALGDNHALSADSRYFGFLPQQNIRGAPSYLIWPPGPRWGSVTNAPWLTLPNAIIWTLAALALITYIAYTRYKHSRPIFKKRP